jgi:DNA ligase 1
MYNNIKNFDPIYKRDTSGSIRTWSMQIGYDNTSAAHRVVSGVLDGKMVTSEWKTCKPKNVGKSNETTAFQQAESEVLSLYTKKLETGYFNSSNDIDGFEKTKPMLAHDYTDNPVDFKTNTFSQPKLDGGRAIARKDGLWTRTGKRIVSCPHIEESLSEFFKNNPDEILDGELYNHNLRDDFNKIMSLVRKTKPTIEDIQEAKKLIEYHVYDVVSQKKFTERIEFVNQKLSNISHIVVVPTVEVKDQQQLNQLYVTYLENGYEGQMVRKNTPYEHKRTKKLLKRKEFITSEFDVVSVTEGQGNWSGHIKQFILRLNENNTFGAGVRGDSALLKELFESEKTPDWATVRYFTPTPDGIPRFPVVITWGYGIRDY